MSLHSIDHINIVVQNLETMTDFYTRVLGLQITKRATITGPWIQQVVGLSDVEGDVVYLDLPAGPRIELIRYNRPTATTPPGLGQPNTPGLRHLAFKVSNIDAIVEKLTHAGVRFFSDVQQVPDSQVIYAGGLQKHLVYFHDPEENLLELCEYKK